MTAPLTKAERMDLERLSQSAEALLAEYAPEHQQPGDITLAMAQERWGCSPIKARRLLAEIVTAGKVREIRGVSLSNGRRGRVWRRVKKGKK